MLYLKFGCQYLFHHSNFHYLHLFNFKEIFPKLISDFKTESILSGNDHALVEFAVLKDRDHIWSNITPVITLGKQTSSSSRRQPIGSPGRWSSGTRGQNRGGRSLRRSSMQCKTYQSPGTRNWARKERPGMFE